MNEDGGNTPVIIGIGQISERTDAPDYRARSPMDLAGDALAAAIADAGAASGLPAAIDTLGAIRQFEMSRPDTKAPFGRADNPPRAIARRVGANPHRAILETTGGQTGQNLIGEFATDIAQGRSEVAAIAGAEAISTVRALSKAGETRDWSEDVGDELEDRGYGLDDLFDTELLRHGAASAIAHYALFENARRARLRLSPDSYRQAMGELFAPFTRVAAANPHAAAPVARTAHDLAAVTPRNRIVAEPYPRMTVARDQVNQGAAIIVASMRKARELGVPESRWVHIHAVAAASEPSPMARADLGRSPASTAAIEAALARCGRTFDEIRHIDLYSCFAIPVFNLTDHFGLSVDDPRGLTLTGGLPFFGGPGNNYSTHAIAEAVSRARATPGSYALVGANGGLMSKYSAAIYSTDAADWSGADRTIALPPQAAAVRKAIGEQTGLTVETYTIVESERGPLTIVLGRNSAGERIAANADMDHAETRAMFEDGAPFGARLTLSISAEDGRTLGQLAGG
ncbi:acetyl-CoA acetyltransferase [Pelagerythrobacter marensis]|uniref:Acetyl-CoA acetyltransferase n=1 Tax=Pelagerythrobacter marensis TaxID=543877 RepID=A0A0G3XDD6_9SPHN|nr:acetyl-CoA acetyltransferase [Pelagerythrobacter marensis]AKM08599.1 Acetyl-CoA acetyltransferase [Pelagerythrobacter marensis]